MIAINRLEKIQLETKNKLNFTKIYYTSIASDSVLGDVDKLICDIVLEILLSFSDMLVLRSLPEEDFGGTNTKERVKLITQSGTKVV
jgi:hypothetical protein